MILDGLLLFDSAAAITVTRVSTNVIDLQNARDLGNSGMGKTLKILAQVATTFTAAGAATLQTQFQGSTDNSGWTTYLESAAEAVANLSQGRRVLEATVPRPAPGAALPRYLRLNYIVATGPMTAGTITSTLVLDRQDLVHYPPGLVIST